MKNDYFKLLKDSLTNYTNSDIDEIKKAYNLAYNLHYGQYRESGEEYITHPVAVSKLLIDLKADKDTIIAGLLHDVIEDSSITKEEICNLFNSDVAKMVDGVTKLRKMDFLNVSERDLANTRKIITSMNEDLRIVIIKLCDRLHNMRTLEFKLKEKQIENSRETMELFVPLANYLGIRDIKNELEDLSFKYLDFDLYKRTEYERNSLEEKNKPFLNEMLLDIQELLNYELIPNSIRLSVQNIYSLYKELEKGKDIENVHNLFGLKIIVDSIKNCYLTLGKVHEIYHPLNDKFKDYISNPKTNMYSSLHTTVFGPNEMLVQTRIRTYSMDKIATYGLASYWNDYGKNAKEVMKEKFIKDIESISEIDSAYTDNLEFIEKIKSELLCEKIYVYSYDGKLICLPKGSNIVDYAYIAFDNIKFLSDAIVNNFEVPLDYILRNNDTIKIITSKKNYCSSEKLLKLAKTTHARNMIMKEKK